MTSRVPKQRSAQRSRVPTRGRGSPPPAPPNPLPQPGVPGEGAWDGTESIPPELHLGGRGQKRGWGHPSPSLGGSSSSDGGEAWWAGGWCRATSSTKKGDGGWPHPAPQGDTAGVTWVTPLALSRLWGGPAGGGDDAVGGLAAATLATGHPRGRRAGSAAARAGLWLCGKKEKGRQGVGCHPLPPKIPKSALGAVGGGCPAP